MSEETVTSEMYDVDGRRLYIAPDAPDPFPELGALLNEPSEVARKTLDTFWRLVGPDALRALAEVQEAWRHDNTCSQCLADEECTERVAISGNLTARVNGVLDRARELLRDG